MIVEICPKILSHIRVTVNAFNICQTFIELIETVLEILENALDHAFFVVRLLVFEANIV